MPAAKKFKRSEKTIHIRVPVEYKEIVLELLRVFDSKFPPEQGIHLLHKYINNFK
jgi:hypothetical protein